MKTKYVFAAALTALMLTEAVHTWMAPGSTTSYDSAHLTVRNDTRGDEEGSSFLDTKFFLPGRPWLPGSAAAQQERREALIALLATYEQR